MAPHFNPTVEKRVGRFLRWLFPSRRAAVATAVVEVAVALSGMPAPLHVLIGLTVHLAFAFAL